MKCSENHCKRSRFRNDNDTCFMQSLPRRTNQRRKHPDGTDVDGEIFYNPKSQKKVAKLLRVEGRENICKVGALKLCENGFEKLIEGATFETSRIPSLTPPSTSSEPSTVIGHHDLG